MYRTNIRRYASIQQHHLPAWPVPVGKLSLHPAAVFSCLTHLFSSWWLMPQPYCLQPLMMLFSVTRHRNRKSSHCGCSLGECLMKLGGSVLFRMKLSVLWIRVCALIHLRALIHLTELTFLNRKIFLWWWMGRVPVLSWERLRQRLNILCSKHLRKLGPIWLVTSRFASLQDF